MNNLVIDDNLFLAPLEAEHAPALFEAVDNDRSHLAVFLPWVNNMRSVQDFSSYIKNCELLYRQQKEISFVIIHKKNLVGRIGLNHIDQQNKTAAIGYWLVKSAEGAGIISKSCKALIHSAFNAIGLNRIEIRVATHNKKSEAIPKRLGFIKEGVLRQAEIVNETYFDITVYALLKSDVSK